MIRLFFIIVLLTSTQAGIAQDFKALLDKINSLESPENYKQVDQDILEVANYLLSQPLQRSGPSNEYKYALESLLAWGNGTPDYKLILAGRAVDACRQDELLINLYLAGMVKFLLEERYQNGRHIFPENDPKTEFIDLPDVKETLLEGARHFFEFVNSYVIVVSKPLQKGVDAMNKGKLEKYMFG